MADRKPDAGAITGYARHMQNVWGRTHAAWRETDTFIHQTYKVWTDPRARNRPNIHPSLSTAILNHAIDSQMSFTPRFNRPYMGDSVRKKEDADRIIEPWLNAAFEEMALLEPLLVGKQIGRHLLAYGYAVLEAPIYTHEGRPEKPERKDGEDDEAWEMRQLAWEHEKRVWLPFRMHAPNPARILLDPFDKRPHEGVKVVRRYSAHLERLTRLRMEAGRGDHVWRVGDSPYELIDTHEYWSDDWHCLVAGGELIIAEENVWHIMPYKHAFAGYGQEPTQEDNADPSYLAQGVLHPVLEDLRAYAQHVSGRHNMFLEVAFNDRTTTGDAAEIREQLAEGHQIIEVPQGQELKWMDVPQFPQWALESERMILQDIEQGTYASSLAGLRQEGVSTVGQQAILSTAAGRKFEAPSKQLEHLFTHAGQDVLRLVEMLGEPVTVRGITLRPGVVDHDYSVTCSFELVNPVLQLQQKELGMREVAMGLKSTETYWSADARLEDAAGERVRLLEDQIRKTPIVQELLAAEVMDKVGLAKLVEQMVAQGGVAPGEAGEQTATAQGASPLGQVLGPDGRPLPTTLGTPNKLLTPDTSNPGTQALNAFTGSLQGGIAPKTPAGG